MLRGGHGGGCCGMTNIYMFPAFSQAAMQELEGHIDAIKRNRREGLIEVVLIDVQLRAEVAPVQPYGGRTHVMGGWADGLKDLGFILVRRFRNSNHGNWCNVFHLPYGQPTEIAPIPFEWEDGVTNVTVVQNVAPPPPPAPPPPRVTIVHTTFHNVYRDGRRGGGYDTPAEARAARRSRGRIDSRVIWSNGNVEWNENIPQLED